MNIKRLILIGLLALSITSFGNIQANTELSFRDTSPIKENVVKGVVLIDDLHGNDYITDLTRVIEDVESRGFIAKLASDFPSWSDALDKSHYLLITAPSTEISASDISAVKTWFESGSRNLLLASRGDFNTIDFASMNSMLSNLGSGMQTQDDNVYTTDPSAWREWYIDTNNFNTVYPFFNGVNVINFFSPSSVSISGNAEIIVNAEKEAYQTDNGGSPPAVVYDSTNDGVGGESIPLAGYEEVTLGSDKDRIIVVGTTLWADFDYGDSDAEDYVFFGNVMEYFADETRATTGDITINLPDNTAPNVDIEFPHNNAFLKGTVDIKIDAEDPFGIASYEISIDDEVVSTSETFSWDTTTVTNGKHDVTVKATDPSGNTNSQTNTYTVHQDFVPFVSSTPKIMAYNIKESGIFAEWMDVMKEENADVVMLIETGNFDDNNNQQLNDVLDELNNYFFDEKPYQGVTLQGIDNPWNGITLLSRYNIRSNTIIDSVTLDSGNNYPVPLPFLSAKIDIGSDTVNIIGAHLTCCTSGADARISEQEGIINYMDEIPDGEPIIYLGDMNSESPDDYTNPADSDLGVEPIDMILNPSNAKSSTVHTFKDVHIETGTGNGYSFGGFSRIDYIFVNSFFDNKFANSTTGDTASAEKGSDHVSVDVDLDFTATISEPVLNFEQTTTDVSNSTSITPTSSASPDNPLPIPFTQFVIALVLIGIYRRRK